MSGKISDDTVATLTGTEMIPVVIGGLNKRTSPDDLAEYIIENGFSAETASRVAVLDAAKKLVSSSITLVELGHLSGVSANIATSLSTLSAAISSLSSAIASCATLTGTETLTNKRITERVAKLASSGSPTVNVDNVDWYELTALAVDVTAVTIAGTPTDKQPLVLSFTSNASPHNIDLGASFNDFAAAKSFTVPANKRTVVVTVYNTATSVFDVMSVTPQL